MALASESAQRLDRSSKVSSASATVEARRPRGESARLDDESVVARAAAPRRPPRRPPQARSRRPLRDHVPSCTETAASSSASEAAAAGGGGALGAAGEDATAHRRRRRRRPVDDQPLRLPRPQQRQERRPPTTPFASTSDGVEEGVDLVGLGAQPEASHCEAERPLVHRRARVARSRRKYVLADRRRRSRTMTTRPTREESPSRRSGAARGGAARGGAATCATATCATVRTEAARSAPSGSGPAAASALASRARSRA